MSGFIKTSDNTNIVLYLVKHSLNEIVNKTGITGLTL